VGRTAPQPAVAVAQNVCTVAPNEFDIRNKFSEDVIIQVYS